MGYPVVMHGLSHGHAWFILMSCIVNPMVMYGLSCGHAWFILWSCMVYHGK